MTNETARLTADVVALSTRHDGQLCVLLIRRGWDPFQGYWALPGGHVDPGEATETTAARELREETGLSVDDLTQVGAYAAPGRDPRGRYVTFAYVTQLPGAVTPTAGDDAREARWWPVTGLPEMAFDHHRIIADALTQIVHTDRLRTVLAKLDELTTAHRLDAHLLTDRLGPVTQITDRDRQVAHEASEESFRLATGLLREAVGGDR